MHAPSLKQSLNSTKRASESDEGPRPLVEASRVAIMTCLTASVQPVRVGSEPQVA